MKITDGKKTVISIHAPREGGDGDVWCKYHWDREISIHAPREGGDQDEQDNLEDFNISIHAPREGGDNAE